MNEINKNNAYYNFENTIKSRLDTFTPSRHTVLSSKPFLTFDMMSKSGLEILVHEVFCRTILLITRTGKCFYTATICLVSPLYLLAKRQQANSPLLAMKNFYKEVRHLGAETFEIIGVIFCSILLLPFNRTLSNPLIKAQFWIEKTAELISGERTELLFANEIINSANTKLQIITNIMHVASLNLNNYEKDQFRKIERKYLQAFGKLDPLLTRRISRNHIPIWVIKQKLADLDKELDQFESIISEKICNSISIEQQAISRLQKLKSALKTQETPSQNHTPIHNNLYSLGMLRCEKQKIIQKLHLLYDPENIIKNKYDCLIDLYFETQKQLAKSLQNQMDPDKKSQFINQHCSHIENKLYEIDQVYLFSNVAYSNEEISESFATELAKRFIPELNKKLNELENLLYSSSLPNFYNENLDSIDHQQALKILQLKDSANQDEIRKKYLRLSLIHHPDKGGNANVFQIINKAYQVLKTG